MRSTSLTPPTEDTRMVIEDDDEITFVSEVHATPTKSAASSKVTTPRTPSTPGKSDACKTPSPGKKRPRITATEAAKQNAAAEQDQKAGEKPKLTKKMEQRNDVKVFIDEELEYAVEEDKKEDGPLSPSKKPRIRKSWTIEEDTIIAEHLMKNYENVLVQRITGRSRTSVDGRTRIFIREALRGLHGENAIIPAVGRADASRLEDDKE
ncbi:uncharacterized protein UTRI_01750 [Ustilago trichophora]|uniref:Uncharacterized protein n=1 Tax=Ustilago trichophora TaxID=86804 RepID=A0A5C3DXW8_9BASI|nr:uncharacterized protein UTRI_01750 [Ustilago trichophora]